MDTGVSYFDLPDKFILVVIIVTVFNDHAVTEVTPHFGTCILVDVFEMLTANVDSLSLFEHFREMIKNIKTQK